VTELPFYAGAGLLRPGLASWSVEAGMVRRGYGIVSDGYAKAAGASTVRIGVFDWLTLEAHAEGMSGLAMGGAGAVVRVGTLGILTASLAGSTSGPNQGGQASLGFERQGQVLSFAAAVIQGTSGFRDIAARSGSPVVRSAWRVSGGISLGRFGSLGIGYVSQSGSFDRGGDGRRADGLSGSGYGLLTASYTLPLTERVSFFATGYDSLRGAQGMGISAGVSISLQPRRSASANFAYDRRGGATGNIQFNQAATLPGEFGLHVLDQEGTQARRFAQAEYLAGWGRTQIGVEQDGHSQAVQAEAHGAVVFAGGGLFAANRIEDSYAVVRSGDIPNVGVEAENRPVGRTDGSGRLLVTGLRAWEANTLSLVARDLPADVEAPALRTRVSPRARSGVLVDFATRRSRAAIVVLTDAGGTHLPLGTQVRAEEGGTGVVGFDGETYLTDLPPAVVLVGTLAGGRTCRARFDYLPEPGTQPRIGPVPCQ
jgi:outer membrane usher protein